MQLDEFDGREIGDDPLPQARVGCSGCPIATQFSVTPQIIYHVTTLDVTYGLLDRVDLNVAIPVVVGDFDIGVKADAGTAFGHVASLRSSIPLGFGDVLLRVKRELTPSPPWQGAIGIVVRLPTGDPDDARGTGEGELGWYAAAAGPRWWRLEPQANLGFDFNLEDIDRSSGRYALGVDLGAASWLGLAATFLGRHEVGARVDPDEVAAFHLGGTLANFARDPILGLDFGRKDYFDFALGLRVQLYRTLVGSIAVLRALNDDGLRSSDWSPVAALEVTF